MGLSLGGIDSPSNDGRNVTGALVGLVVVGASVGNSVGGKEGAGLSLGARVGALDAGATNRKSGVIFTVP